MQAWPEDRVADFMTQRGCRPGRVLVFIARLEPEKRIDLLIDSFGMVADQYPDLRLVILGDGSARGDLERRVVRARLEAQVLFEGAVYDEDRIAPWMAGALCMAYPGPIGLSLLHAFAYGVPVITHRDRQAHGPEIDALVDNCNGLLVSRDDPAALATAIASLADDCAFRNRLAESASATLSADGIWSLESMVAGFTRALRATASI
jgi:glycosyltransferase involved in cell wall biosynthesis